MHTDRKARVLQAFRCWDAIGAEGETPTEERKALTTVALEEDAGVITLLKAEIERLKVTLRAAEKASLNEVPPTSPVTPSVILVDAVPDQAARPLREVLDEFFVQVEVEKGIVDVALLDYNRGFIRANAYFAKALREGWKAPSGFFTARSDEPYLKHFEHALRRAGFTFVRGVR